MATYEAVVTDDEDYGDDNHEGQVHFSNKARGSSEILPAEAMGHGMTDSLNGSKRSRKTSLQHSDPDPPADLDEFFKQMYEYYRGKGYWPIVIGKVAALYRVFFMVSFATFGIVYLKWESLALCTSQEECLQQGETISDFVRPLALPPLPAFIVTVFVLVFAMYWMFDLLNFLIFRCWWIRYMRRVYEEDLQILPHELRVMSWDQVVERYQQMHRAGRQKERRNEPSTAHEIAMRIMRKENYFVYLVDQGMFEFRMNAAEIFCCLRKPCLNCCCGGRGIDVNDLEDDRNNSLMRPDEPSRYHWQQSRGTALKDKNEACYASRENCTKCCRRTFSFKAYFSPLLVRALRWLITDQLVQQKDGFRLDREQWQAISGERRLRRQSRCLAFAILLAMPFILMYQFIEFFLRYAQEFSKSAAKSAENGGTNPTSSRFTPYWKWMFREYNELPHVFERRISLSIKPAQKYLSQFYNPVKTVLARTIYFVSGSFIALLLVMSLLGDSVMLHISILDRNLLWYLSVFGAIAALSRSSIPPSVSENAESNGATARGGGFIGDFQTSTSVLLRQVVTYTHWRPTSWFGTAHTLSTRDSVSRQMKLQIVCMLMELRSTLFLPYILAFKLPHKAADIIERIDRGTVSAPSFSANPRDSGIGDVCRPSLFLVNDRTDSEQLSKSARLENSSPDIAENKTTMQDAVPYHSKNAKIEKSLLNFRTQHPTWVTTMNLASRGSSLDRMGDSLNMNHTGGDLVESLARFQGEQVGKLHDSNQSSYTDKSNPTLNKMAEDLSTSRILADGHVSDAKVSTDDHDEEIGGDGMHFSQQSASLGRSSSNFFSTNHMVELPVDHPSTSGIYPSAEPLFFWLDKFYEGKAMQTSSQKE